MWTATLTEQSSGDGDSIDERVIWNIERERERESEAERRRRGKGEVAADKYWFDDVCLERER